MLTNFKLCEKSSINPGFLLNISRNAISISYSLTIRKMKRIVAFYIKNANASMLFDVYLCVRNIYRIIWKCEISCQNASTMLTVINEFQFTK